MEEVARVIDEVASEFVNVVMTKLLIAGCDLEEEYIAPLYIHGQLVEQVKNLGFFVEISGNVMKDVQDKIGA